MVLIIVITDTGMLNQNWVQNRDRHLLWCKENCNGYFILDVFARSMKWSFVSETDAMAFKLRWCQFKIVSEIINDKKEKM